MTDWGGLMINDWLVVIDDLFVICDWYWLMKDNWLMLIDK